MAHTPHQIESSLDVLRLSAEEIEAINRELDLKAAAFQGNNRRQDERHPYRRAAKTVVTAFHPGGSVTRYLIEPRNISRTGLAFLHGSFLHLNTQLVMAMETLAHRLVNVTGTVVHCKYVRGNVHEIGVRFNQPVDLAHYVLNADGADELPRLVGRVLCVEAHKPELHLLRHLVEQLGAQASGSAGEAEALGQLKAVRFDAALVGIDGDDTGVATLRAIRKAAADLPLIALTADDSDKRRKELTTNLCTAVLVKPVDAQAAALTLLQYLPLATEGRSASTDGTLQSTMWQDHAMRPLILEYLDGLEKQAQSLAAAVADDARSNSATLSRTLLQIKGSAGSYGYPSISDGATQVRRALENGKTVQQLKAEIDELAQMCGAACRVRQENP